MIMKRVNGSKDENNKDDNDVCDPEARSALAVITTQAVQQLVALGVRCRVNRSAKIPTRATKKYRNG